MASWNALPVEIWLSIWEALAEDVQRRRLSAKVSRQHMIAMQKARVPQRVQEAPEETTTESKAETTEASTETKKHPKKRRANAKPTLASAAAVSRFWQAFFEPIVFRSLVLEGEQDVAAFIDLVRGGRSVRLAYIRHLRLHILLPDYDCSRCRAHESPKEVATNNQLLSRALWPLLATLADWKAPPATAYEDGRAFPALPAVRPGLSLELSAGSWSDAEHFKSLYPLHRCFPFETAEDLARVRTSDAYRLHTSLQETNPCFHSNETVASPLFRQWGGAVRLHGLEPLDAWISNATPPQRRILTWQALDLVHALVVRKRFHRAFDHGLLFCILQLGRNSIRTLRIEINHWHVAVIDGLFMDLGRHHGGFALQSLHVIGQFSWTQDLITGHRYDERTLAAVAKGAFHASRSLTHLTAVRYALADRFFSPAHVELVRTHRQLRRSRADVGAFWPRLETVSLHEHSDWEHGQQGVQTLVRAAAVLREMPKLRLLELCNQFNGKGPYSAGERARSCFFRFEAPSVREDARPCIVFGGHWDTRALWTDECRTAWEAAVARACPGSINRPLRVQFHGLSLPIDKKRNFFASPHHGTVLDHPLLLERKIDPVSLDMTSNWLRLMHAARLAVRADLP